MTIDLSKIDDIKFAGVDYKDAPDYVDAYISEGYIEAAPRYFIRLTDAQLEHLNGAECAGWRYEKLMSWIH